MQMQMNNYGRGFGGPPQPQRAGGARRGFNRGGGGNFRQSRFEHNNQRNQNPNQNQGQRPNENIPANKPPIQNQNQNQGPAKPLVQNQPAQNQPAQNQQAAQTKPQAPPQKTPQQSPQQQPKPQQPQQKPQMPQQAQKPPVQQQQTPKPQPQSQPQMQKPPQNVAKPQNAAQDKVDAVKADPKPLMQIASFDLTAESDNPKSQPQLSHQTQQNQHQQQHHQQQHHQNQQNQHQQQQQQRNMNGNFGGNKQGGWQGGKQAAGGPGNRQFGGPGNKQGGGPQEMNRGQGMMNQGPRNQGPRNQDRRGPMNDGMREENMLSFKLKELQGPILELPPLEQAEVRFNGRSRLYIGNLSNDMSEEDILKLFAPYGETSELFHNKEKNFGFIKMDYRVNAEKAKRELDGQNRNGRTLRVRFAPHNSAVRVKNLPPFVSNELLFRAFEIFGKIERAYVKVDERGKTLGEGVVEFVRKPSALAAIRNCTERCFFLTASLRPVIVEMFEEPDEFDGFPEKNLPKKHPEFLRARELGPRFSEPSSFEHEYGTRWKQLYELHRQKEEALKKELVAETEKLEAQMEYAKYEHETELLREQLRQREQDRERQKRSWEQVERAAEERRESDRAALLRQEEELAQRMRAQDDELRRRQQENTLFVQAQRLNSMLDRQEQGMFDQSSPMDGGFREQFDMGRGYDDMPASRGWEGPRQIDDYPNKRRRF